jgi:hypothetical protein
MSTIESRLLSSAGISNHKLLHFPLITDKLLHFLLLSALFHLNPRIITFSTLQEWNGLPADVLASFLCKLITFRKRVREAVTSKEALSGDWVEINEWWKWPCLSAVKWTELYWCLRMEVSRAFVWLYKHWRFSNSIAITEDTQMDWDDCVCVLVTCVLLVTVYVCIFIVCTLFCIVPFMYSLVSVSVSVSTATAEHPIAVNNNNKGKKGKVVPVLN